MAAKESLYYTLIGIGLVIIFLPAIVGGGFLIAGAIAAVWLVATLGGPQLWDLYKTRRVGEKGMKKQQRSTDIRDLINTNDGGDKKDGRRR